MLYRIRQGIRQPCARGYGIADRLAALNARRPSPILSGVRLVLAILLLLTLAACGGSGGNGEVGSPEQAILAFDSAPLKREPSLRAVYGHIHARPAELREAALNHLRDDDPDVRYASLFALAMTAERGVSLDALRPFLGSADPSERLMAAGTLVAKGEKAGLPILIEALTSTAPLRYEPSRLGWEFARSALIEFTDEDMGLLARPGARWEPEAVRARWRAWWEKSEPHVSWTGQYFTVRT